MSEEARNYIEGDISKESLKDGLRNLSKDGIGLEKLAH
jgi:hypothetical protein